MDKRKHGEKFDVKYGVKAAQIYRHDPGPDMLIIPPPGHFLHDESSPVVVDEQKVAQIDSDGKCSAVIEVWTDKNKGVMYVLDGRETLRTVREVNRRRAAEGREPVDIQLAPQPLREKEAVAHVAVRNFHRRNVPTHGTYALNIRMQRKAGWSWDKICDFLLIKSDDPEQWCKKRLPLVHVEPEVRQAFDAGEFPLALAPQFGGRSEDGSDAPGRDEQLCILEQKRAEKLAPANKPRGVPAAARKRIAKAMLNGETAGLCHRDAEAAKVMAATIAYVDGDASALDEWPDVRAIAEKAAAGKKVADAKAE